MASSDLVSAVREDTVSPNNVGSWTTIGYQQLPHWLQGNRFIRSGYRPPLESYTAAFFSLFRLHTETFNAWTHLGSGLVYLVVEICVAVGILDPEGASTMVPLHVFRLGAIVCFCASAAFHTFQCVSEKVFQRLATCDYSGIVIFMCAGGYSWINLAPRLTSGQRTEYTAGMLLFAIAIMLVVFAIPNFSGSDMRGWRAVIFVAFAACLSYPVYKVYQIGDCNSCFSSFAVATIASFLVGIIFYGGRVPERFVESWWCDVFFQSHIFWHIAVMIGSSAFYCLLLHMAVEYS